MRFGILGAAFAAFALGACTVDLVSPEPTAVTPSWGWNGEDTRITVSGEKFYPRIEVDASGGGGRAQVNSGFEILLEGQGGQPITLEGTSLQDYRHITATVPQGLTPGLYDLVVQGPTGEEGRLNDAFTVSATRADRISVDSDTVVYEVYETAWVDIGLLDPQGEPVLADLTVVVVVTDDDGAVPVTFEPGGLEDQQPFGAGFGILGRLGEDGAARVGFTVDTPNTVDVVVAPGPDDAQQVAEGVLKLRFEAGSELQVDIALPDDPFETTAGTSFPALLTLVDQFGNPLPEASELIILKDSCDSWVAAVQVDGEAEVDVTLDEATGTSGCPSDRLVSVAGPAGQSGEITVHPGPVAALEVVTSPGSVVAGQPALDAVITPVDAFGNDATWTPGTLTLTDSLGGVSTWDCGAGMPVFCTVTSVVAGTGVRLQVEDAVGISGTSGPYEVLPADPAVVDVDLATTPLVAGDPVVVKVRVRDAFGNVVPGAAEAADVTLTSAGDAPSCSATGTGADGGLTFSCALYLARDDAVLEVQISEPVLSGASDPFVVENGPLAAVTVAPASAGTVAGQALDVDFTAFDAWGNPWLVQDDPVLQVADTGGTLSLTQVALDAAGTASGQGSFTLAGTTRVLALRDGAEVGRSAAITVAPGAADALGVEVGAPWVWVGEEVPVAVEVLDAWGNRADWTGTATLAVTSGNAASVLVGISAGAGVGGVVWDATDLSDSVHADAPGGLTGDGAAVAVLEACSSGGPSAEATFGGFFEAVLCLDGQGEATLATSLAGSTAGSAALGFYGVRAGDAWVTDPVDPTLELALEGPGRFDVEAVVAGFDGCGDTVASAAWVGPDDGQPTGPLVVDVADPSLSVGQDVTTVSVTGATDCSRDVAAGASVRLRTDRGRLDGPVPTGSGLVITLDASGDGTTTLDATESVTGGTCTVVGWAPSGTALGAATTTFLGDDQAPRVWDLDPVGDTSGFVDTVTLAFSEAMLASTVLPSAFEVSGPATADVIAATLQGDQRTVLVTLDPAADADAGVWVVNAKAYVDEDGDENFEGGLRDLAGNRLDGSGTGGASDFVASFGVLAADVDPVSACVPDVTTFRPDGDDGAGTEADVVTYAVDSNSEPTWWLVSVNGPGGLLRHERVAPLGAADTWTWDGRDATGRVVASGAYLVVIDAEDAAGNRGGACTASVTVAQHAEAP